ncbi:DUF6789 family protein [Haloplanus aerogenes]|uniref:Cytochrome C oxidase subunit I n=1 Tax=Haloplanus aerogenes TaxID=660522 RepID=A0A3M0DX45_9EURY|nr:DUF6789 family protein [Haloplanus aerogenes]AZH24225.1 cytochrome C oxidase subunit I [Haloplanus aerogenes]RMB24149.1 hypothetical protein ATH50_1389 [Haloplanus aerogenes]
MVEPSRGDTGVEGPTLGSAEEPLTMRIVASAFLGGVAGLVVMTPVIVGIPMLLGIFQLDPLAGFADLVIAEADAVLGLAFFVAGGVVVLPLFFVVTASFLPPREPKYLRGATISSFFWVSFVYIFWPSGGVFVNSVYVVVTLASHWIYGAVLGLVMERLTGIPSHRV